MRISGKGFLRKSAALAAAGVLTMTGPNMVMASDTYHDTEKKRIESFSETVTESWDKELAELEETKGAAKGKIALNVADTGRALLGYFVPFDISWLKNVAMGLEVAVKEGNASIDADILLNDISVCTMNMVVDLLEKTEYVQIPEFSENYLKIDIGKAFQDAEQYLKLTSALSSGISGNLPDAETVQTLVERYCSIILGYVQEGPSLEEEVSVEGIKENCTVYEGQIKAEDLKELAKEILNTAKEDKEIREVFEKQKAEGDSAKDAYAEYQKRIDDLLAKVGSGENTAEDNSYISSKIWVNEEDKVVGREFALCKGVESDPVITWKSPKDGNTSALLLEVSSNGNGISLSGTGEASGGLMNGEYTIAAGGAAVAKAKLENYDTETAKKGYRNGTITFSLIQPEAQEGEGQAAGALDTFGLVLDMRGDVEAKNTEFELTLTSSGSPLGSILFSASPNAEPEAEGPKDTDKVYDSENEDDMTAYAGDISLDTLKENVIKAGVPEEVLDQIIESFSAGSGENGETAVTTENTAGMEAAA